jgi:hypothetical protein
MRPTWAPQQSSAFLRSARNSCRCTAATPEIVPAWWLRILSATCGRQPHRLTAPAPQANSRMMRSPERRSPGPHLQQPLAECRRIAQRRRAYRRRRGSFDKKQERKQGLSAFGEHGETLPAAHARIGRFAHGRHGSFWNRATHDCTTPRRSIRKRRARSL